MAGLIVRQSSLGLQTRLKKDIANLLDRTSPTDGMKIQVAGFEKQFPDAYHGRRVACRSYNCHGLTFATRRTAIDSAAAIRDILADDDYEPIDRAAAEIGDVAVYFNDGDAEHSGIVVRKDRLNPFILSKWGGAHEVIHKVPDCPYNSADVRFYRVCR